MLLFFRTLKVILLGLLSRRSDLYDESRLRLTVWPNDCDLNLHLNDGRFISIAGLGRVDLLTRTGLLREGRKRGWFPVVGGTIVRYRASLLPFERFTLRTRALAWDDKWVYFEHLFERRDGSIAARVIARGLLRSKSGPVTTGDAFAAISRTEAVSPPLPEEIKRWSEVSL